MNRKKNKGWVISNIIKIKSQRRFAYYLGLISMIMTTVIVIKGDKVKKLDVETVGCDLTEEEKEYQEEIIVAITSNEEDDATLSTTSTRKENSSSNTNQVNTNKETAKPTVGKTTTERTTVEKTTVEKAAEQLTHEEATDGGFKKYDIPLSEELQIYTYNISKQRGLEYELVLAVMYVESTYREKLISSTNDYGIMQINTVNHSWLRNTLGVTDFLDAKQNINCGTYMLSDLFSKYNDVHKTLMAYNFGEGGAKRAWNNGNYSSQYSRKVVGVMSNIIHNGKPY